MSINNKVCYLGVVICYMAFTNPVAIAVPAQIIGSASTGMVISQVSDSLNDLINKARDAGDYLTIRAAVEAKGAIELWKDSNKELLNIAFSKLDESQRNTINNFRQLTENISHDTDNKLENVQKILDQSNQIVESLPTTHNTYITGFSPRVKPAQSNSSIILRVRGVNLDKSNPVLSLGGHNANRMLIGPTEIQYTIPVNALKGDDDKISVIPLQITYTTLKVGFWNKAFNNRESMVRQLPIVLLPVNIGRYNFIVETKSENKVIKLSESQPQLFRGTNTDDVKIARPPEGWRWDWSQGLNAFKQKGSGGEAGHCNGIRANESTPDGITHTAHLDRISEFHLTRWVYGPGWQSCSVVGPIYQMASTTTTNPTESGVISWTDDVKLNLPKDTDSLSLEITTFDGRKRLFSDSGADKFFDVIRGKNEIIIRPRQPTDL
ncbi:hypothetical protein [Enterobacter asburiae]|jgi:hypothetical protein|uniref:hypothetical protein n=1 Tax=Enterobacter asburiae TaxID=61645 RepID=UPI002C95A653|nr:hypothetical protein [Enterobacter asburiae]